MANVTYDKQFTALLVIDPYNDFISEGGKIWDRLKGVAEANKCVPHMMQVLDAARKADLVSCMRCTVDIALATTRIGSTLRRFRRQRGCERALNTARGVARSGRFAAQQARHRSAHRHRTNCTHVSGGDCSYAAELGYKVMMVQRRDGELLG